MPKPCSRSPPHWVSQTRVWSTVVVSLLDRTPPLVLHMPSFVSTASGGIYAATPATTPYSPPPPPPNSRCASSAAEAAKTTQPAAVAAAAPAGAEGGAASKRPAWMEAFKRAAAATATTTTTAVRQQAVTTAPAVSARPPLMPKLPSLSQGTARLCVRASVTVTVSCAWPTVAY